MRTIVDIPDEQIKALATICRSEQVSRAELVRRALDAYLKSRKSQEPEAASKAFGLFKQRPVDGLKLQRKLRDEWS